MGGIEGLWLLWIYMCCDKIYLIPLRLYNILVIPPPPPFTFLAVNFLYIFYSPPFILFWRQLFSPLIPPLISPLIPPSDPPSDFPSDPPGSLILLRAMVSRELKRTHALPGVVVRPCYCLYRPSAI